jgi:hypothetical protein
MFFVTLTLRNTNFAFENNAPNFLLQKSPEDKFLASDLKVQVSLLQIPAVSNNNVMDNTQVKFR